MLSTIPVYLEDAQYCWSMEYREPREREYSLFNGEYLTSGFFDYSSSSRSDAVTEYYTPEEADGLLFLRSQDADRTIVLSSGEASLIRDIKASTCIYCAEDLASDPEFAFGRSVDNKGYNFQLYEALRTCSACGWWCHSSTANYWVSARINGYQENEAHKTVTYGRLRTYDVAARDVPIRELRNWLQRHPTDLTSVNPFVFERLIADCFEDRFPGAEVVQLGGVKDKGIDIKLVRSEHDVTLVQIKRRASATATESVQVVRELNGVLMRHGISKGMVVTTAQHFSPEAVAEAQPTAESLLRYNVDLLAFDDVLELLQCSEDDGRTRWYQNPDNLGALPFHDSVRAMPGS